MLDLVVYSRRGCHLCEHMLEELAPLCGGHATIRVVDVDGRQDWQAAYGNRVPVLCLDKREVCAGRLDRDAVLALFANRP
ncbi:MAG: glutaredoxin family protein [Gammaproteobacteria bacterium]